MDTEPLYAFWQGRLFPTQDGDNPYVVSALTVDRARDYVDDQLGTVGLAVIGDPIIRFCKPGVQLAWRVAQNPND